MCKFDFVTARCLRPARNQIATYDYWPSRSNRWHRSVVGRFNTDNARLCQDVRLYYSLSLWLCESS